MSQSWERLPEDAWWSATLPGGGIRAPHTPLPGQDLTHTQRWKGRDLQMSDEGLCPEEPQPPPISGYGDWATHRGVDGASAPWEGPPHTEGHGCFGGAAGDAPRGLSEPVNSWDEESGPACQWLRDEIPAGTGDRAVWSWVAGVRLETD